MASEMTLHVALVQSKDMFMLVRVWVMDPCNVYESLSMCVYYLCYVCMVVYFEHHVLDM
jgi:hypothetical protein